MGKTKTESGETQILGSKFENPIGEGAQRGLAIVDLVVRVMATMATLSSAIVMGTANQTLPFSTQTSQFKANYKDLPMFMFFVLANSIVCGYLFLSLPLSIFHIMEVASVTPRLILLIFDMCLMVICGAIFKYTKDGNGACNSWCINGSICSLLGISRQCCCQLGFILHPI
ncbi:casparian strip membrane protein 4-like isoform X2 [Cucumis sativus]|uniref:casparian strip membrane protein 4-like isoform X2 n=1 Tax=Cucumis sativus TaxID=3659 RepID=UPI0012F507C7|nr:casparian strip membrane protein 4-like isoform X2 [Cucumis sativus]KAE8648751.1 hypothetical protein Csa_008735 [Cucumis sativus]